MNTARFQVSLGVPAVLLRVLLVTVATVGAFALIPIAVWQGVAIAASLLAAVLPRTMAAWIAIAGLAFGLLLHEPDPARTALAVLLVHVVHVIASLTLLVPAWSRVSLSVLMPSLGRLATIQLIAQPLALTAWLVPPGGPEGAAWLAPLGAAALLLGVVVALRAARNADRAAAP